MSTEALVVGAVVVVVAAIAALLVLRRREETASTPYRVMDDSPRVGSVPANPVAPLEPLAPSPLDEGTRLARSGLIERFVRSKAGAWNHRGWLDFLAMVRAAGYVELPDDEIGRLLEHEKANFRPHADAQPQPSNLVLALTRTAWADLRGRMPGTPAPRIAAMILVQQTGHRSELDEGFGGLVWLSPQTRMRASMLHVYQDADGSMLATEGPANKSGYSLLGTIDPADYLIALSLKFGISRERLRT